MPEMQRRVSIPIKNGKSGRNEKFDESPFFGEESNQYYAENNENEAEDHALEEQEEEPNKLKTFLSLTSIIILIVFVSSFTSFIISHFSNSMDLVDSVNKAVGDFKKDLQSERDFFLNKGEKLEEKIKQSLNNFLESHGKNFVNENFVMDKISLLNSTINDLYTKLNKKISNSNANDTKIDYSLEIESLKSQISEFSSSFSRFSTEDEGSSRVAQNNMDIKRFQDEIDNLKMVMRGLKNSVNDTPSGDFLSNSQLKEEIKNIKSLLSEKNLRNIFSRIRDGSQVDWANKYAGGQVITVNNRYWKFLDFFFSRRKNSIIEPIAGPGDCLAFKSNGGYTILGLRKKVIPTGFTYETIFSGASPSHGSAPKHIRVYAISSEGESIDLSLDGKPFEFQGEDTAQTFYFRKTAEAVDRLKFDFVSNHGNKHFTCVYRIRVHGSDVSM